MPVASHAERGFGGVLEVGAAGDLRAHRTRCWCSQEWDHVADTVAQSVPNLAAFLRLATAVVVEAHDEWHVTRRYLSPVSIDEPRVVITAEHRAAATDTSRHR